MNGFPFLEQSDKMLLYLCDFFFLMLRPLKSNFILGTLKSFWLEQPFNVDKREFLITEVQGKYFMTNTKNSIESLTL